MTRREKPTMGIIVPCFNEESVISNTNNVLLQIVNDLINKGIIAQESFVAFVDDGSIDRTWNIIEECKKNSNQVRAIKLAKNEGHQNALLAGLYTFGEDSDFIISIDADLQDDVGVIPTMVDHYYDGNEVVYGVRGRRDRDTFIKKYTAVIFYKFMEMLGVNIVYNHADFRLTSKKVIESLKLYQEENLFLRGIFPLIGFKSSKVFYERKERKAGDSKYPFWKMVSFAWEGITSFSVKPLKLVTRMGFLVFGLSFIFSGYVIFSYYRLQVVPGWASTVLPIFFLGGVQLLAIGIIGEYLGKIYGEVKRRPRYIIDKRI